MELNIKVAVDEEKKVARVLMIGSLNSDTAPNFERELQRVINGDHALTILDMKDLDYVSSAGLRVIFKGAKQTRAKGLRMAVANRKPHIDKVFQILKALPDMTVFADDRELDEYLDAMQKQVKEDSRRW